MSETAKFSAVDPKTKKSLGSFTVHFNPASMQQSVNNKLKDDKNGKQGQTVEESVTKLTMELVFDTTNAPDSSGKKFANVCNQTAQIAALMGRQKQVPPQVRFEWGTFSFEGMIDSFRETIDFFAEDGTPLRSTVALGMTAQDKVFSPVNGATGTDDLKPPEGQGVSAAPGGGAGGGGGGGGTFFEHPMATSATKRTIALNHTSRRSIISKSPALCRSVNCRVELSVR